ncbi:flavin reductase family protein [Halobacteriovorax sp. GB3]|uniref:flavin reductase family protein n=1 Tax=Halobacteriovorax sp. GB3 TaxID=2719615 RepID=UPI00235EA542|nr:flavin reductase family protein [Halobacteriovorax sp. GB3]MDD0852407.1 flavin reductase family protein [Halobacteriovorax sp. GB3]
MLSFNTNGPFQDNYKFLIGSILPRPIALVSTLNSDGTNNLAPFSFFTAVSASPMIIAFSPMIRSATGEMKDTPKNIIENGEFVINIVSEQIAEQVNLASTELPYGEDEFKIAGLTPIDSDIIAPKRVKESLIHFECKFRDRLSYGDEPGCGQIITGEVVKVHIDESVYENGRIITQKLQPVGRGAGNDWFRCTETFAMERLMKAQIQK